MFPSTMISVLLLAATSVAYGYGSYDPVLSDAFMKSLMERRTVDYLADQQEQQDQQYELLQQQLQDEQLRRDDEMDMPDGTIPSDHLQSQIDEILMSKQQPMARDQERLQHSPLWGHQFVQGGAGEGDQHLKPDGSVSNVQVVKSDSILPAYCNPPNPCPLGYTGDEECLEDFSNSAAFSREYQSSQECMCDQEHMFDCPGAMNDPEEELDTVARSLANSPSTLEALYDRYSRKDQAMPHSGNGDDQHKVVAKKFFSKSNHDEYLDQLKESARSTKVKRSEQVDENNPWIKGDLTPKVIAKKSPRV